MIKLIALDVDGTLINSHGLVEEDVLCAVDEARQSGIQITFISGRTRRSLVQLIQQLQINIPYAGSNGGFITLQAQKEPLITQPVLPADIKEIVNTSMTYELIGIVFHYLDQTYYDRGGFRWIHAIGASWAAKALESDIQTMVNEFPPPLKIEVIGEDANIAAFMDGLSRSQNYLNIALGADPRFAEINSADANKGNALKVISDMLHIPLRETGACGDGDTDSSMLRVTGCPIAMGNARPEVKAAAKFIAPTNDQAGAAWAIRKMIDF